MEKELGQVFGVEAGEDPAFGLLLKAASGWQIDLKESGIGETVFEICSAVQALQRIELDQPQGNFLEFAASVDLDKLARYVKGVSS